MIEKQTKIITSYISVWGWHLLAFMFFLRSLGFLVTKRYEMFGGLIGVFVICEIVALRRKWRLENES